MQLNPRALGWAAGALAAAAWFLLMLISLLTGFGAATLTRIGSLLPFFTYSWGGLVVGAVERLICGFIIGYVFAWLYNKFLAKNPQ